MVVRERLTTVREMKNLSQGDVELETGPLRCYLSRVENGHTVPSIETLEKIKRPLGISLAQLFHENGQEPEALKLPNRPALKISRKHAGVISRPGSLVRKIGDRDQSILVGLAQKMAAR